jgi:hypothetical protein
MLAIRREAPWPIALTWRPSESEYVKSVYPQLGVAGAPKPLDALYNRPAIGAELGHERGLQAPAFDKIELCGERLIKTIAADPEVGFRLGIST